MKREAYQKLVQWKRGENRNPLILKGIRQCGKTYLLQQFGTNEFPRVHYVNFEKQTDLESLFAENLDPQRIINELSFYLNTDIDIQQDLVIFDEIQACPRALTSLKYFQEDMPQLALCSAGSLLGLHLSPASFPVGKVTLMSLYPLSFSEFLRAIDDDRSADYLEQCQVDTTISSIIHQHLWQQMKYYFVVGGLPEVIDRFRQQQDNLFLACEQARIKQRELIFAYYADMAKHAGKVNAMHLERVFHAVPEQLARSQNGSVSRFKFKGVIPGVGRYQRLADVFDWLWNAGLIIKVPILQHAELPLSAYVTESHFKLYLSDVGLLGAMSALPPKAILDYDYGTYKGYFAENFVAQELVAAKQWSLYGWQQQKAEVEFMVTVNSDIIPIEVKSGMITRAQSLQKFMTQYHPPYGTLMSGKTLNINQQQSIHHYPLYLASRFPLYGLADKKA